MRKVDWVLTSGKPGELAFCNRCGEGLNIPLPQRVEVIVAASKAFTKAHANCKPLATPMKESNISIYDWAHGRDTGTSSLTIYSIITGNKSHHGGYDIPHDPDDFGRCYRLLKSFPWLKASFHKVGERCPEWKPYISAWDELERLYEEELPSGRCPKLYQRMQELRPKRG